MLNYTNFFDQTPEELTNIKKFIFKYGHLVDRFIPMKLWAENAIILVDNHLSVTILENEDDRFIIPCKMEFGYDIITSHYTSNQPLPAYAHFLSFAEFNNRFFLSVPNLKHNIEYLLIGKI